MPKTKKNPGKNKLPEPHPITEFLRGQASKIFKEVVSEDKTVLVNKNSKPHAVIISYEKYKKLVDEGADI